MQDEESARRIESGGLVGAVVELGALVGVAKPATTAVCVCGKLLGAKTLEAAARAA